MVDASFVAFSFTLGMGTFFAPCAFPLLPGYVAYFLGTDDGGELGPVNRLGRAALVGIAASLGFFAVYGSLAVLVAVVGTGPLSEIAVLELVVGSLLVVLGAGMATGRFTGSALHVRLPERRRSVLGYFLFGVVYAAAAAGCTAGIFVAVAGVAVTSPAGTAVAVLVAYALGMSVLMVAVSVLAAAGKATALRSLSGRTGTLTRVAGVVLVLAGIVQVAFFFFPGPIQRYVFDPLTFWVPL